MQRCRAATYTEQQARDDKDEATWTMTAPQSVRLVISGQIHIN